MALEPVLNVISPTEPIKVFYLSALPKKQVIDLILKKAQYDQLVLSGEASDKSIQYLLGLAETVTAAQELEPKDLTTLSEWLEMKKIELEKPDMHRMANQVKAEYERAYNTSPRVITRPDSKGRWVKRANGFAKEEFKVLEKALKKVKAGATDYRKNV